MAVHLHHGILYIKASRVLISMDAKWEWFQIIVVKLDYAFMLKLVIQSSIHATSGFK